MTLEMFGIRRIILIVRDTIYAVDQEKMGNLVFRR